MANRLLLAPVGDSQLPRGTVTVLPVERRIDGRIGAAGRRSGRRVSDD